MAIPLAAAVAVASVPTAAQAASPAPLPVPFIGPDGISWQGTPDGPKTNPLVDINTGKPTVPMRKIGWGLGLGFLGLGQGGMMSPEDIAEQCALKAAGQPLPLGDIDFCIEGFGYNGIEAQEGIFTGSTPGTPGTVSDWACRAVGQCVRVVGTATWTTPTYGTLKVFCLDITGPSSTGYQLLFDGALTGPGMNDYAVTMYMCPDNGNGRIGIPMLWPGRGTETKTNLTGIVGTLSGTVPVIQSDGTSAYGVMDISVNCTDGTQTTVITASATVTVSKGVPFEVPEAICPEGWIATGAEIGWTPNGGQRDVISEGDVDDNTRDMIELNPDCFNGNQQCVLELKQLIGAALQTCGSVGQLCPDWASDPLAESHYQCFYGGQRVDLNVCSAYRAPLYGVQPNMDPDGSVIPYTRPVFPPSGIPNPGGTPDLRAECASKKPPSFLEGFSPYWIQEGVRCALVDVFVPRPDVVKAKATQVTTAWAATPMGSLIEFVGELQEDVPTGSGCSGPRVQFDIDLPPIDVHVDSYPLDACSGTKATVAGLARTIGALAMVTGTLAATTRYIGSVVNTPGLGKS